MPTLFYALSLGFCARQAPGNHSQNSLFMLRLRHLQGKTSFWFSTDIYFIFYEESVRRKPKRANKICP